MTEFQWILINPALVTEETFQFLMVKLVLSLTEYINLKLTLIWAWTRLQHTPWAHHGQAFKAYTGFKHCRVTSAKPELINLNSPCEHANSPSETLHLQSHGQLPKNKKQRQEHIHRNHQKNPNTYLG